MSRKLESKKDEIVELYSFIEDKIIIQIRNLFGKKYEHEVQDFLHDYFTKLCDLHASAKLKDPKAYVISTIRKHALNYIERRIKLRGNVQVVSIDTSSIDTDEFDFEGFDLVASDDAEELSINNLREVVKKVLYSEPFQMLHRKFFVGHYFMHWKIAELAAYYSTSTKTVVASNKSVLDKIREFLQNNVLNFWRKQA